MNEQDIELARGWIEFSLLEGEGRLDDARFRYWDKLQELCRNSPERAICIIIVIAEHDLSEKSLALFAAGPIEEILNCNEDLFWQKIEVNGIPETLKRALAYVWRHGIPARSRLEINKVI